MATGYLNLFRRNQVFISIFHSGCPIQVSHNDAICVYSIVGMKSFGPSKCGAKVPAVYTRVMSYLDWIEGIVWP
jgi:secreted trypsin-like serine protease